MTILVLGGRGTTSSRVSALLSAAKVPFLIASRSSDPSTSYVQAKFDWLDESTYSNPFQVAAGKSLGPITGIYVVAPPVLDMVPPMKAFINFAQEKGAKRFVLLSASTFEKGGLAMGTIHEYLASLEDVEWAALRPTWFMENFSEAPAHASIKREDKIYSAAGEGKIPFVSADDIARVAFHALTDEKPHNTDHLILGPELLTYSDVADVLTSVLGRKITHVKLSEPDFVGLLESTGMPANYAEVMGKLDTAIENGAEARLSDDVERVTGKPPRRFEDFATEMKECWV